VTVRLHGAAEILEGDIEGGAQRGRRCVRCRPRIGWHQGEPCVPPATDLNNFEGIRTVEQAAHEPVRLALIGVDRPAGTFSNEDWPLPW
jgi:hypothetical protein